MEEIKDIMAGCSNCKNKISQFTTKKPVHSTEKWTQTTQKPFLIDLIEEKVVDLCRQNTKLTKLVEDR